MSDLLAVFLRYESLRIEPPPATGEKQLMVEEEYALKSIRDFLVFKDGKYKVGLTFAERASLTFAKEFPR